MMDTHWMWMDWDTTMMAKCKCKWNVFVYQYLHIRAQNELYKKMYGYRGYVFLFYEVMMIYNR